MSLLPLLLPSVAAAHDGHGSAGFVAGMLHPVTGIDHLLAIVAVGWWSATSALPRWWRVPLVFVAAMFIGAAAGIDRAVPLGNEWLIVASLLVFGAMLWRRARIHIGQVVVLAAAFAFVHGLAHGSELAAEQAVPWLSGMVVATLALHLAGAAIGRIARDRARWLTPVAGAATVAAGVVLAVGLFAG